jgi:transposase
MTEAKDEQIDDAIVLLTPFHSQRWIAGKLKVGRDRIRNVLAAHRQQMRVIHAMGRPVKATPEIKEFIIEATRDNPRLSDAGIIQLVKNKYNVTIGHSTANRCRQHAKFGYLPPRKCQALTPDQVIARVQFAIDFFADRLPLALHLLFCDESRFCMGPDNRWVWRRYGDCSEKIFAPTDKYAKISIHVWGAIGVGFKSELIIFTENVSAEVYTNEIEKSGFIQAADQQFGPRGWCLVQDGAPCHNSKKAFESLSRHFNIFPSWPPNSPDLNPIEALWGAIKRRLRWEGIKTADEAIRRIREIWNDFDQDSIDRLVLSFPNRVKMVSDAKGRSIQPLISSGKTAVPTAYEFMHPELVVEPPVQWDAAKERMLIAIVGRIGMKWKQVATFMAEFSSAQCKNRWQFLSRSKAVTFPPESGADL